jgi:hypothetical protein
VSWGNLTFVGKLIDLKLASNLTVWCIRINDMWYYEHCSGTE